MNNTMKELKENPNIDMLMRDSMNVNMVDFKIFCNDIANYWSDKMSMLTCEECGELIKAISKYERENGSAQVIEDLINEMGDVIISIFSLAARYRIDYRLILSRCNLKSHFCYEEHKKEG